MWMDLFVESGRRRHTSTTLFEQIREGIIVGRLAPGDQLPTSRELAAELGVSRSTVTTVYANLIGEGFLDARTGRGTFVADTHAGSVTPTPHTTSPLQPGRRAPVPTPVATVDDIAIDLRTGRPDPALFPLTEWRRCVVTALQTPPPGYGDRAGLPHLQRVLAAWINRSRGVAATPEQVIVIAGAQQGIDLIARVIAAPGDTVAVENPGYPMATRAFGYHGLQVAPVPVDSDGIVVDAIPPIARLVYVTPSHQSPTGVTMSAARRRALLDHARRHGIAVVEDDYDTEFRHVDRPLEPLHRLDTTGHVIYLGSFSKTLSPSLRIGFMIAPPSLVDEFCNTRALLDTQPPHVTQAALAEFISAGHLDRHLRRTRRIYSARHTALVRGANELAAAGQIDMLPRSNAGLHAMIPLRNATNADAVSAALAQQGTVVHTAADWWIGAPNPALVVGFGLTSPHQLDEAFRQLGAAVRAHSN